MASLLLYRNKGVPSSVPSPPPLAGIVISVILSFSAISVLSWFLTQRSLAVKTWWHLPPIAWLVFTLYVDSWTFVFATGIINYGIGVDSNLGVCSAAILSYLFCYISTKVLIYMFLVEKAFIIRGGPKRRLESKLYLFNSFGMLTIHGIISILNFVYRVASLDNGRCIIGIGRQGLIPMITFDIAVIVYLTVLFLNPLRNIPAFQGLSNMPAGPRLRNVAMRTFIGAMCTTTSTVVNLLVLMILDGEPGWVFLTCCNADILFSALVIQWVSRHDPSNANPSTTSSSFTSPDKHTSYHPAPAPPPPPPPRRNTKKLAISLPLKTTSTSQYEHIFGDPEPEPETSSSVATAKHKLEPSSFDEHDDPTATTIPIAIPIPAEIELGGRTASPTITRKSSHKDSDRTWLSTLTRAHAHAAITDRDLVPAPLSPAKPAESPSPSVSAAVAADLERIRRYRDRRAPPSPSPAPPPALKPTLTSASAPTSALARTPASRRRSARVPGSASEYRISELAFEGGEEDLPWHDLVVMEEGEGGRVDMGGWI
ncbi:hypothetical protein F4781DRAFT_408375 [Annulohypoxylon bovei var. microspora]|nr:hypothetical protein F4781DRAFT_408375 [Annulohypoxylon bovei var. microspora]